MHHAILASAAQTVDFPWDKAIAALAGGSAATLVVVILVIVLRRDDAREARLQQNDLERDKANTAQHAKCNDTIATCTQQFAATIDKVTARSDDRFEQAMTEQRAAHDRREEKLIELLRARVS